MISKVKLLKNIGKFYDFAAKGDGVDWHKNTFLFGPNAYGKTTLVNVLRSLRNNDPKLIRARKTLNVAAAEEAAVASRIQKLEQDIKSKESETHVRVIASPSSLFAPSFALSELKTIATQKVAVIHEATEKRVLAHITRNFKDKANAKEFIRQGLDLVQADCPFCGQD